MSLVTGQYAPTTKTPPTNTPLLFTKKPQLFSKINHYKKIFFVIQMFINVFPRFDVIHKSIYLTTEGMGWKCTYSK